jgi:hypothetical protein
MLQRCAILILIVGVAYLANGSGQVSAPNPELSQPTVEATTEEVHNLCGACHAYPPADSFPRSAWRREVIQGFDFFRDSALRMDYPSLESVVAYYEKRAPEELPLAQAEPQSQPPIHFRKTGYRLPDERPFPAVANVNLVHLFDKRKLDILVCDLRHDLVAVLKPYETPPAWQILAKVSGPVHAEVVDLDRDGIPDIIVAGLGNLRATDALVGSVVWLRGRPDGSFQPVTLLENVGRVADVQVADFNGDGKLDLVVGVFGWRRIGEILYLENRTTDWSKPAFVRHVLDDRHGTIHVPVCDLSNDGRPDFVALISQEHETIVAFLNDGKGMFTKKTLYTAPHPAYGSSGIQLVDLNGDGRLDVLYTNGDVLDSYHLKPYHSIQWLENKGALNFEHHHLASMYGVERAVAADISNHGRLDILAVSCLPAAGFPQRDSLDLDSIIMLEQTAPGQFVRHSLEKGKNDHCTCAVGELYGDGRLHLVTANLLFSESEPLRDAVEIWQNQGRTSK